MIFEFTYEGKAYDFDDERMGLAEARYLKREFGLVGTEFFTACRKLDPDALIALLVLAMRRAGLTETKVEDLYPNDDNGYYELVQSMEVRPSTPRLKSVPSPEEAVNVVDGSVEPTKPTRTRKTIKE